MGFDLSLTSNWLIEIECDRLMAAPGVSKHLAGSSPTYQAAFLAILASFDYDPGLITEDVFKEAETVLKHLPGRHDQRSHGRGRGKFKDRDIKGGLVSPDQRVWQGVVQQKSSKDKALTKLQKGFIGEEIAAVAMEKLTNEAFEELNVGRNNAPIDIWGNHTAVEVKAASAGSASKSWRSVIGGRGKAEKKRRKKLTGAEKKAESDIARANILKRKHDMLRELTALKDGERINGKMVGVILSPDGKRGDAFLIDGFHLYIGFASGVKDENYLGTYNVGSRAHAKMLTKAWSETFMAKAASIMLADGSRVKLPAGHTLTEFTEDELEESEVTQDLLDVVLHPLVSQSVDGYALDDIFAIASVILEKKYDLDLLTESVITSIWTELEQFSSIYQPDPNDPSWQAVLKEREKSFDQDEAEILTEFERLDKREFFNQPTEPNFFGKTKIEKEFSDDKDDMLADYEADLLPPPARTGYQKAGGTSWQEMVVGFSKVMAMVHLALRMNEVDIESLYDEMYKARKTEFDDAVSDYLAQMDCGGKAHLKAGPEMKLMKAQSRLESEGIADTYNRDLAKAIQNIRDTTPGANRYTYVSQLRTWESTRRIWKMTQIALHTIMTSRDQALKAFSDRNGLTPDVELYPRTAAEPICQGWINRSSVSYQVAKNNPSPYHVGCLHYWRPKFVKGDCDELWIG